MPQDGSQNYYYPPGTRGIPDETIESPAYNNFLDDLVGNDLNIARPIHRGGTGATTADQALINLGAEKATQLVANYDSHVWLPGSFRSAAGATAAPVADHAFAGIVYINEPLLSPPTNANVTVSARDMDDTVVPSRVYVREKKANVWGAWTVIDATTLPFPPGGGLSATTILAAIQELAVEKADITYVDAEVAELKTYVDLEDVDLQNQINALDTEKADVTYVNSVTSLSYDGLAFLGLQTNGSFIVNQERNVGIQNTVSGLVVISDGWKALHGTNFSRSIIDYSSMGMNLYTHSCYQAPPALAAGDAVYLYTAVEGFRFARVGWGTDAPAVFASYPITISFLARHARVGTYCVAVRHPALTASYVATYTQDVADAEQYHTLTIPIDATLQWDRGVNPAVQIVFTIAAGTNFIGNANAWNSGNKLTVAGAVNGAQTTSDRFRLRGVMVNMGTVAPTADRLPYILRPHDEELRLCQRYFQTSVAGSGGAIVGSGMVKDATTAWFHHTFAVPMRVPPTLNGSSPVPGNYNALVGASAFNASAIATVGASTNSAHIILTSSGMTAGQGALLQVASLNVPSLKFDASM